MVDSSGFALRLAQFLALLTCAFWAPAATAQQTTAEVEARLRALQTQVDEDAQRLADQRREEASVLDALESLAREQATRSALAETYRQRARLLRAEQADLSSNIARLEEQRARQQEDYRSHLIHLYKRGTSSELSVLLGSETPAQLFARQRYLQRFAEQRTASLDRLRATAEALEADRAELARTQRQVESTLAETEAEEARLEELAQQRSRLLANLRSEQATLQAALAQKQTQVRALQQRVQQLVAEARRRREAAAAREAAARAARDAAEASPAEGTSAPPAPTPPAAIIDATPEAPANATRSAPASAASYRALSRAFSQNRGRLPWPVQGAVAERFGTTTNPVYGTRTPSLGIVIQTESAAPVRSVFAGEVVGVDAVLGFGSLIMIEHGSYQAVYSNFSRVDVQPGQRVRAGQTLGLAGTPSEPKGRSLFFAVFDEGVAQDPLRWLQSR